MNKNRRKELNIAERLIYEAKEIINSCRDEEDEYIDNMPENMKYGEKGDRAYKVIDSLDNCIGALEESIDYINEAV